MDYEINDLPGEAWARKKDDETSHSSARKMRGEKAKALERKVLEIITIHGPRTSEEVANLANKELGSITPRFAPLARDGEITKTRDKRPGKSGHNRRVWRITTPEEKAEAVKNKKNEEKR